MNQKVVSLHVSPSQNMSQEVTLIAQLLSSFPKDLLQKGEIEDHSIMRNKPPKHHAEV